MTPEKVSLENCNKIIAEFMGREFVSMMPESKHMAIMKDNEPNYVKAYSHSLDALLPVIEKLKDANFECFCWLNINKGTNSCEWKMNSRHDIEENESPSIALAIATAKAILELSNNRVEKPKHKE